MSAMKLYDLSHPFGHNVPLWPYFPDVKIERFRCHASPWGAIPEDRKVRAMRFGDAAGEA